jgi:pilus assembly protein CpaF
MRSETAEAIDFALYCERAANGRRQVRELITVDGYDYNEQRFETEVVYSATTINAA